jgi:RND superfamily putative drug exporter
VGTVVEATQGDMFERLGRVVIRFRFLFLVGWLVAALVCFFFAPSLEVVGTSDEKSFLPNESDSQEAGALLAEAFPSDSAPGQATIVFSRAGGLTDADRAYIASLPERLAAPGIPEELTSTLADVVTAEGSPELAPYLRSGDGEAEIVQVNLAVGGFEETAGQAVDALREILAGSMPAGLQGNVTGDAGIAADYLDAVMAATDRTTVVTVILVLVILLLMYRAPLAALAPLLTIGVAWTVARGVLGWLAQAGWQVSSTIDTFMVVLIFGVGTDYSIFLISRVREELARDEWAGASRRAVGRIGGVITASAATVVVGLASMAVARFGFVRTIGPALAVAIVITLLAGLTLTPAYLGLFGRFLFWPFHRRVQARDARRGPFAGLARLITDRPAVMATVLVMLLAVPALAMPLLRADFNQLQELPGSADGRNGYEAVGAHFDAGQLSPTTVVLEAPGRDLSSPESLALLLHTQQRLAAVPGVGSVSSLISPSGDGTVPDGFRPSAQLAAMADRLVPEGTDQMAALRQLLEEDTEAGIAQAAAYIEALGESFPSLAEAPEYRASLDDLDAFSGAVALLRSALRVSTQLEFVAAQVSSVAAAGDPAGQVTVLQGYLGELAAAYPEVEGNDAYRDARATLGVMAGYGVNAQLTQRLAASLRSLSGDFADRPDAYLISTLLSSSTQGQALGQMLQQPLSRLPGEITTLAAQFQTLPDLFLPVGLSADGQGEVAELLGSYLSADGEVTQLRVVLAEDPYSNEGIEVIPDLRRVLKGEAVAYGPGARILTGGLTAAYADIHQTIGEDFWRVAAITVAGVLVVLIVLLRAVVAPIYLVATVLLSWMATMGLAALLFQGLLGHSGVSYFLSLIVFVLLVALGSDYNIFLMSRVREESARLGIHDGIRVASARTGSVITSAGIILAGTFAALAVAPLRLMLQVGVTVALGVLIDTFVVRSMLVPAITALFGKWAWWPWHRRPLRTAEAEAGSGEASEG